MLAFGCFLWTHHVLIEFCFAKQGSVTVHFRTSAQLAWLVNNSDVSLSKIVSSFFFFFPFLTFVAMYLGVTIFTPLVSKTKV